MTDRYRENEKERCHIGIVIMKKHGAASALDQSWGDTENTEKRGK